MAWIRWRQGALGPRTPFVQWKCRKPKLKCKECAKRRSRIHSVALDSNDERLVDMWKRHYEVAEEGRSVTPVSLDAWEALSRYIAHKELVCAPNTVDIARRYLEPLWRAWEKYPMRRWNRPMFEQYVATKRHWAPRTMQMLVSNCKRMIAWAAESEIAVPDFVGSFRGPSVPVKEVRCLTIAERDKLLDYVVGHRLELPIGLACLAGLRMSEILSAKPEHIDWQRDSLLIVAPKTKKERRVPIAPKLRQILKRHRVMSGQLVRIGGWKNRQNTQRSLTRLCELAEVPRMTWHPLRHTFGSALAEQGQDYRTIGFLMGHAPGSTVTLRYLHTDVERLRSAVQLLE